MSIKNHIKIVTFTVMILLLVAACSGKGGVPVSGTDIEVPGYSGPAWHPLALLKTGEHPLWFELAAGGPVLIESPDDASLAAYSPWPFARFIIDMQVWDDFLAMAVNRDGFLVLGAAADDTEAVLYRARGGLIWNSYTAESFFVWDDKPAVLLYRNDFFIEPTAPSLQPQVYVLDMSSPVPVGASVPALENFPPGDSWEAEVLHRGPGGLWYYRLKEKGKDQANTVYFRTESLEEAGTRIAIGEWRNSNTQEIPENVARCLAEIINAASGSYPGGLNLVKLISPENKEPRVFVPQAATGTGEDLLYVYCREADQFAIAIFPDGQGYYSGGKEPAAIPFTLPPLPEGFGYTGIAVFGKILVASWEEQQDASIGAAGFMVISLPF